MTAGGRGTVAVVAAPGIAAARAVYTSVPSDSVRVAALVEISAAAAALARTVVKLRHLDVDLFVSHVTDPVDLRAVLGRGRWLPTMVRHVRTPATGPTILGVLAPAVLPTRPHRTTRTDLSGQEPLFAMAAAGGGDGGG